MSYCLTLRVSIFLQGKCLSGQGIYAAVSWLAPHWLSLMCIKLLYITSIHLFFMLGI